jgi:hypothetical protein
VPSEDILRLVDVYGRCGRAAAIDDVYDTLDAYLLDGHYAKASDYMYELCSYGLPSALLISAQVVSRPWYSELRDEAEHITAVLEARGV